MNPYDMLPMLRDVSEVYEHLSYAWEAFWKLSDGRNYTASIDGNLLPSPITFDSIYYYAKVFGYLEKEEFEELETYIRTLDTAYINYQRARQ